VFINCKLSTAQIKVFTRKVVTISSKDTRRPLSHCSIHNSRCVELSLLRNLSIACSSPTSCSFPLICTNYKPSVGVGVSEKGVESKWVTMKIPLRALRLSSPLYFKLMRRMQNPKYFISFGFFDLDLHDV
jgi:hypothetical protein